MGRVLGYRVTPHRDGPGTRFALVLADCPARAGQDDGTGGERVRIDQVLREFARYRRFITVAGGGVTVGGSEPLRQAAFTRDLLVACHQDGLHTALATSGRLGPRADERLLGATDLVLLDLHLLEPDPAEPAGRSPWAGRADPGVRFAQRLARCRIPVWIRIGPGALGVSADHLERVADLVAGLGSVERVELRAGPGACPEGLARVGDHFARRGLTVG
jgi:pyruvate formate lyase activating enzyme